jgi:hypothetical protein
MIVLPAAPLPWPRLIASADVAQAAGPAGALLLDGAGGELEAGGDAEEVTVVVTVPPDDGAAVEPHAASRATPQATAAAVATRRVAVDDGIISLPSGERSGYGRTLS